MTELVLTYIGTLLIALEFVRGAKILSGFKSLQALVGMLLAWPFRPYLNAIGSQRKSLEMTAIKTPLLILLFIYALIFLIIMLPVTIAFYLFYFIITPLELMHFAVNKLYFISKKEYRSTYGFFTRITLSSSKKYKNIAEKQVINEIQKGEIPILPIIGIILITIAFVMFLV
jgi:hypothetical protein